MKSDRTIIGGIRKGDSVVWLLHEPRAQGSTGKVLELDWGGWRVKVQWADGTSSWCLVPREVASASVARRRGVEAAA